MHKVAHNCHGGGVRPAAPNEEPLEGGWRQIYGNPTKRALATPFASRISTLMMQMNVGGAQQTGVQT